MAYVEAAQLAHLPIDFMNADHAQEFHLLEALGEALAAARRGDRGLDAVLERLALLAVHTREHFLREEAAMREARYAGLAAHKAEHDRALAEMDAEARRYREGGEAERLERYLLEALPAWWFAHIRAHDGAAARHLAERGAAAGEAR
jgi:hemerythrin